MGFQFIQARFIIRMCEAECALLLCKPPSYYCVDVSRKKSRIATFYTRDWVERFFTQSRAQNMSERQSGQEEELLDLNHWTKY